MLFPGVYSLLCVLSVGTFGTGPVFHTFCGVDKNGGFGENSSVKM